MKAKEISKNLFRRFKVLLTREQYYGVIFLLKNIEEYLSLKSIFSFDTA